MRQVAGLALFLAIAAFIGAVMHRSEPSPSALVSSRQSDAGEGQPIAVRADPGASYRLIEWRRIDNGNLMTLTRRDDGRRSQIIRAEIDCRLRRLYEVANRVQGDGSRSALRSLHTASPIARELINFVCTKAA